MIKLIMGPMRSGKSMMLLREAEKLKYARRSYVLIRPKLDTREFIARSFKPLEPLNISKNYADISKYDYILLDEFHLFEPEFVTDVLEKSVNKNFIISGLSNGTNDLNNALNIEILKNMSVIIPYSEEIIKLNSICEECGSEHANYMYTKKITISDDYKILCRKCRSKI